MFATTKCWVRSRGKKTEPRAQRAVGRLELSLPMIRSNRVSSPVLPATHGADTSGSVIGVV